jgi:hypothetical protein
MCGFRGSHWLSVIVITEIYCLNTSEMNAVRELQMLGRAVLLIIVSGGSHPTMVSFSQSQ